MKTLPQGHRVKVYAGEIRLEKKVWWGWKRVSGTDINTTATTTGMNYHALIDHLVSMSYGHKIPTLIEQWEKIIKDNE